LTDQNALAKHCTCLGVGEAKLFQVSKRALLSSCWVFDWCGKLWQTVGSMPMRRKDWSTRHGFTKHPTHTTRAMRTEPWQSPWVTSSDAMRCDWRLGKSSPGGWIQFVSLLVDRLELFGKAPYLSWHWRGDTLPGFEASVVIQLLGF